MSITYTHKERTEKKYTVGNALEAAKVVLSEKRGNTGGQVCTNALKGRNLSDKITIVEHNEISERIVDDTLYYS